jgi:hypothetical protein
MTLCVLEMYILDEVSLSSGHPQKMQLTDTGVRRKPHSNQQSGSLKRWKFLE